MAATRQDELVLARDMPEESILGANIYRYRTNRIHKMTQEDLARAIGKSRQTVALLEAAKDPERVRDVNPRLDTLKAIARVLGVSVGNLFDFDEGAMRVILYGEPADPPPTRALTSVNMTTRRTGIERRRSDHIQSPLLSSLSTS